jgi:hypothetical protein
MGVCSCVCAHPIHKSSSPGPLLIARHVAQPAKAKACAEPAAASKPPGPSTVCQQTESSVQKTFRRPPNKADPKSGWGPIENLTVAALGYNCGKPRVPREDRAFTELAEWLYDHCSGDRQGANTGQANPSAAEECNSSGAAAEEQKGLEYYQRLAVQLLPLHNSAMPNLMQPNPSPQLDVATHCARQLWNSIPQPDNMPAVRILCSRLTAALRWHMAPHTWQETPTRGSCCTHLAAWVPQSGGPNSLGWCMLSTCACAWSQVAVQVVEAFE